MSGAEVLVLETGVANTASVLAGLNRAGARPRRCDDPAAVESAERVVLPGVGAFGAGMQTLEGRGLARILASRVREGRPTLAICLGLQLLCEASDESPGVRGLGVLPVAARRFAGSARVPQLGWNRVSAAPGSRVLRSGWAYFANSYRVEDRPPGWTVATTEYGGRFVSALERGALVACQFHPELSGTWGIDLLRRWMEVERC
jgi:imidazole glycerol phosphate synthase glutamine amidotransferase subunit